MNETQAKKGLSQPVLILVVLAILAAIGLVVILGTSKKAGNINEVGTTNQPLNTNQATNAVNTNVNTVNTNAGQAGTEGWKTYTNDEYGYSLQYPADWKHEYKYLTEDPLQAVPTPIRYSIFTDGEGKYQLTLGIKKNGDAGTTYYRTGIGAGEIQKGQQDGIAGTKVDTWELVYSGKTAEVFFFPVLTGPTFVEISGYQVSASVGTTSDYIKEPEDIKTQKQYVEALGILRSLRFN